MKKDIAFAITATILVLQLIGNTVGGFVGTLATSLSSVLSERIQIEQFLSGE
jgi:hypothetical protein